MLSNPKNDELVRLGMAKKMPDGSLQITDQEAFFNLPFNRMMNLVREVFQEINHVPKDHFLTEAQSQEMVKAWVGGVISVPKNHPEFNNPDHQTLDMQQLGILDEKGELVEDRVTLIAQQILRQKPCPKFVQLLKFVRNLSHTAPKVSDHDTSTSEIGRNDPCPCGSGKKFKKCCFQ